MAQLNNPTTRKRRYVRGDQPEPGSDFLMAVLMAVGCRQACYILRLCAVARRDVSD
jgi:hypothetical protein